MFWGSRVVIAIPVKNEEARIGRCLNALARQTANYDHLVLLLNNCTDDTLSVCNQFATACGKTQIVQHALYGDSASAGEARRLALKHAAGLAGNGIILTTDADAEPDINWVAANLAEIRQGADAVCGMAELDSVDALKIPEALRLDDQDESRLLSIQDEITAMVDPSDADPWPRHQHHSGASMAMRAAILRKAGGAPHVATGEDRALIQKLLLVDARIRHAPEITVKVSGRLDGRAQGGMAATLKRRLLRRDTWTDDRLEPTVDAYRRVLARQRLGNVIRGQEDAAMLAADLLISNGLMRHVLGAQYFGASWAELQRISPVLQRRQVPFSNLEREIRQAVVLREQLREERVTPHAPVPRPADEGNLSSGENAQ